MCFSIFTEQYIPSHASHELIADFVWFLALLVNVFCALSPQYNFLFIFLNT